MVLPQTKYTNLYHVNTTWMKKELETIQLVGNIVYILLVFFLLKIEHLIWKQIILTEQKNF